MVTLTTLASRSARHTFFFFSIKKKRQTLFLVVVQLLGTPFASTFVTRTHIVFPFAELFFSFLPLLYVATFVMSKINVSWGSARYSVKEEVWVCGPLLWWDGRRVIDDCELAGLQL